MYLIDTNVVSEFRKAGSGRANPRVASWAAQTTASSMYLSVVTILELQIGALRIERRDPTQSSLLQKVDQRLHNAGIRGAHSIG